MEIPPGLEYLARVLPLTLLPCAVTFAFLNNVLPLLELGPLPLWSRVLAAIMAQPASVVIGYIYNEYQQARDAASRGAAPIPLVHDKWGGLGLTLVSEMMNSFRTGYPVDFLRHWFDQYGNTVMAKILFESEITTLEPEYIKAILATDFNNYWKDPNSTRILQSLLGNGIFNTDGEHQEPGQFLTPCIDCRVIIKDEMWKFHRSLARPFFSQERIRDFDIFDDHAGQAISLMRNRLAEGHPIDFQDVVSRFTLDSATEFLFERSVDSMAAGLPYPESWPVANSSYFLNHPSNTYVRSFVLSQTLLVMRAPFGSKWPLSEFWKDKIKPHRKIIDEFIEPLLNRELERKNKQEDEQKDEGSFLTHLVQATDDKDVIRDSIFNILIAGRDTTAATLTFGVYMLAEHRDIMARLRNEILNTVGSSRMPTYDDLRNMKYLRAFINETLRLYPPVPIDTRVSKNATTWPPIKPGDKPLYVPAHTTIRYSVFWMHRRTDLWGPDASKFDPDRFLDERLKKYLTPHPYIFLPFNAGPRICLGQQFAYNETAFFLVRLLQNFAEFSLAPDAQPESSKPPASWKDCEGTQATEKIMLSMHLTMYAKGGLWVRMKEVPVQME
ncbi:cytochrome P450 monooxygenase pc-2 [Mycena galericulata]|nr:cytochrome P450 monooxygenase pc-2 [Mycena galericulata]